MVKGTKLDLQQLAIEIRTLHWWQPLYKVLKKELSEKGYWKERKRGAPEKGYAHGMGKYRNNSDG